jgi:hypothetical protein
MVIQRILVDFCLSQFCSQTKAAASACLSVLFNLYRQVKALGPLFSLFGCAVPLFLVDQS